MGNAKSSAPTRRPLNTATESSTETDTGAARCHAAHLRSKDKSVVRPWFCHKKRPAVNSGTAERLDHSAARFILSSLEYGAGDS
jgi:hypothetical protein